MMEREKGTFRLRESGEELDPLIISYEVRVRRNTSDVSHRSLRTSLDKSIL